MYLIIIKLKVCAGLTLILAKMIALVWSNMFLELVRDILEPAEDIEGGAADSEHATLKQRTWLKFFPTLMSRSDR